MQIGTSGWGPWEDTTWELVLLREGHTWGQRGNRTLLLWSSWPPSPCLSKKVAHERNWYESNKANDL